MRVTPEQLIPFGADGMLVHAIDTAFFMSHPKRVGIAVSGGGDSMALLHAARRWSDLSGTQIEAVTVDHGLRIEAKDEAAMVAQVCADWKIPHHTLSWDGTASNGNVAAAGRDARYALMADWAKRQKIDGVLLGHTQDDIAETFLMRLARKSGVDGLAMMDTRFERDGMTWARPFWQQPRDELRDYLKRHDVPWVDDPTNSNEAYDRPKARKILKALAPLGIKTDTLKSVAMAQRSARDALVHYTVQEAHEHVRSDAGDLILKRHIPIPYEVKRRLWLGALQYVGDRSYAPREHALDELERRLNQNGKSTLAGCVISQSETDIRVTREMKHVQDLQCGVGEIWDGRWQITVEDGAPASPNLVIKTLGSAIKEVPNWRESGVPRASLMVTPAVFDGDTLVSAPFAGHQNGFEGRIVASFTSFLLSR